MSTKTVSYTLSLLDRASAPMRTITGNSLTVTGQLGKMQSQAKALQAVTQDLGGSLMSLRGRMDLLKAEKELINPKNLSDIKRYNREIQGLEKQIDKLDRTGTKKGGWLRSIGSMGPLGGLGGLGVGMAVGAGAGLIGGGAMKLDEQFAKVNVTAQLDGDSLEKLKADILGVAKKNKVDLAVAPEAFEKILSQTNDVDLSLDILNSTLKGSKAGFTDTATVADALAQSLSIVGKENATANQVLDTFFAAKRVGAGEFKDFAAYMPGLIASGNALGLKYKEVAGVFAYMTGKGQSAERASVLMNNMFSMLGRKEVTDNLGKEGVAVFDNGQMRSTVDIFRDLQGVMSKMNDEKKSAFIEQIGVVDKEAKSSFMVMTADVDKLNTSLQEVANSVGETDRALALSANSVQRSKELWASTKGILLDLGTKALPLINGGMWLLGGAVEVVGAVLGGTLSVLGGWSDALADGNPLVWGLTAALGAAGVMLAAHQIKLMAVAAWNGIVTATSGVLAGAIKVLNAAFVTSPLGWIALGIGAVVGVMASLSGKTDKATQSFAAFNVELGKSKNEAKGSFDSAIQAAKGSDERKEAIHRLNEQYGSYLPNLLHEKSSNDQLAAALNMVNGQLERKLLNKFRDQATEEALTKANEAKTEILGWMLDQVDGSKQKQLSADFSRSWEKISAGKSDWKTEEAYYQKQYGVGDGVLDQLMGGIGFATGHYSNLGGKMQELQSAAFDLQEANKRIDLLFTTAPAPTGVVGGFVNGKYVPAGQYSLFGPSGTQPTASPAPLGTSTAATTTGLWSTNTLWGGSGGGKGSKASHTFDLGQVVTNAKGSTAYNAVVGKLNRVKLAGLAAASVAGVAMSSPALSVPPISEGASTAITARGGDFEDYGKTPKRLSLEKFCDQVVIHIAKADDQGMDEIREKIVQVLKEVANGQQG